MRMSQKLDRRGEPGMFIPTHIYLYNLRVEGGIAESMKFPCAHKLSYPN